MKYYGMGSLSDQEWQATLYYEGKIKEAYQKAFQEGFQIGKKQAILKTLVSLMKKGKITEADAAEEAGMSIADFKEAVTALD